MRLGDALQDGRDPGRLQRPRIDLPGHRVDVSPVHSVSNTVGQNDRAGFRANLDQPPRYDALSWPQVTCWGKMRDATPASSQECLSKDTLALAFDACAHMEDAAVERRRVFFYTADSSCSWTCKSGRPVIQAG